jgi:hypothetical protein
VLDELLDHLRELGGVRQSRLVGRCDPARDEAVEPLEALVLKGPNLVIASGKDEAVAEQARLERRSDRPDESDRARGTELDRFRPLRPLESAAEHLVHRALAPVGQQAESPLGEPARVDFAGGHERRRAVGDTDEVVGD